MTDTTARWSAALDALAALVARQRSHLAGEAGPPTDVWTPPTDPLPAELRTRAIVLRHETDELAAQISRHLVAVADVPVSPYA